MGQGGQSFVRGINDSGELIIRWFENNKTINCKLNYQLPVRPETLGSIDTLLLKNICQSLGHLFKTLLLYLIKILLSSINFFLGYF